MSRKIEQLLRVASDLHRFSESNSAASSQVSKELFEDDLELISAAAYEPVTGILLSAKSPEAHTKE